MAELRPAQANDVGAIVAIDPLGPGRAEEIRALVNEHTSLVAIERGQLVGFLALRAGHFYQRDFIDLLFVAPGWRRHGLARTLLRTALQNASTPKVFTSTNKSNTPMRELLRSEGWTPSGILTGLDEGDPEHVFFHDVSPREDPPPQHRAPDRGWPRKAQRPPNQTAAGLSHASAPASRPDLTPGQRAQVKVPG